MPYVPVCSSFLSVALLQGFLLSAVFYAFLNISRDIAKYLLYPHNTNEDARNTLELPDRFIIQPNYPYWDKGDYLKIGAKLNIHKQVQLDL